MNIYPFVQIGGINPGEDLALSVERRVGRMPIERVHTEDVSGAPHLVWTAADGEVEAVSFIETPYLAERVHGARGFVFVEHEAGGFIESSSQLTRAEEAQDRSREACNG